MIYAKYLDIPRWESYRDQLIDFYDKNTPKEWWWWCHFEDEVKTGLPDLYKMFVDEFDLHLRQLIYFGNFTNDLTITDPTDSRSIFIHIDRQDNENQIGIVQPEAQMKATPFPTTNAINIPMTNYENSYTIYYKELEFSQVLYTHYGCGGLQRECVEEVFRFQLDKPAVIRINKPHGVYNPNDQTRWVATMRFHEDLEKFLQ